MSEFFVDTSALAKRYVTEMGSRWIRSQMSSQAGHVILISSLSPVEMVSLLIRRQREGSVSPANRLRIQNHFLLHAEHRYLVVEPDADVLFEARSLLVRHPLRALDALQVASALQAARALGIAPTFVSADTRLLAAASAEGLAVDDPNAHP